MTVNEIRAAKQATEKAILWHLEKLRRETGICPEEVKLDLVETRVISSPSVERIVAAVFIKLEPI